MSGMHLIAAGLGDVPILAKKTAHVAAGCAHRKNLRTGKKVIERLFLYGVDLQGCGGRVTKAIKFASPIDANKAEAALPFTNVAVTRAKIAVHAPVWLGLPPAGLVQFGSFLQNLQVLHEF